MGKRNSFMTGALAAMVGMAIGASFSGSETTAFGAADPNRGQTGFRPVAQEQTVQTRRAVLRHGNRGRALVDRPALVRGTAPEGCPVSSGVFRKWRAGGV